MAWLLLFMAGCMEVGFALSLKASDGFSRLYPTLSFIAFAIVSFVFLNLALRSLPVGTAYAVWTGIGASGTILLGMIFLDEPVTPLRIVFLSAIVAGIAGLQLAGAES